MKAKNKKCRKIYKQYIEKKNVRTNEKSIQFYQENKKNIEFYQKNIEFYERNMRKHIILLEKFY